MQIFVAASYSSRVNYETGLVHEDYKRELEEILAKLESYGHMVFCALRADGYRINDADPAGAFRLDMQEIDKADGMFAIVGDSVSAGVQTEMGIAYALQKRLVIAHYPGHELTYFNRALVDDGHAKSIVLPFSENPFL